MRIQPPDSSEFMNQQLGNWKVSARHSLVMVAMLVTAGTAWSAAPLNLKDAYKDHFLIGAAINRSTATGGAVRTGFFNRSSEQIQKDVALFKEQFNQVAPENDLKWALIHPREGEEGYDRPGGCLC
ncbi:MAG: endo-1,4-beta-xylanase [Verrucomicrobiota bacterium]